VKGGEKGVTATLSTQTRRKVKKRFYLASTETTVNITYEKDFREGGGILKESAFLWGVAWLREKTGRSRVHILGEKALQSWGRGEKTSPHGTYTRREGREDKSGVGGTEKTRPNQISWGTNLKERKRPSATKHLGGKS